MAYSIKKDNLQFSLILEEGLLGNYSAIASQNPKLKFFHRNFYLSKKKVFSLNQGISQDVETGCLKLAIVKILGVQYLKGDQWTTIYSYFNHEHV